MPRKDAVTGKRLSGTEERKIAEEQKEKIYSAEMQRAKNGYKEKLKQIFDSVPDGPIGDPTKSISWANDLAIKTLQAIAQDESMPLEIKSKLLFDGIGKLGMIRDKASEQKKIDLAVNKTQKIEGADDVSNIEAPKHIKRPL